MSEKVKRTIFDIDADILNLIDDETGEVSDYEKFEQLGLERDTKIENACMLVLDLNAQADAILARAKELTERAKKLQTQAERVQGFVDYILDGAKFATPNVEVKYTNSKAVQVDDGFVEWAKTNAPDLVRVTVKEEPDKTKIKEALNAGNTELQGCSIVEKRNIKIK